MAKKTQPEISITLYNLREHCKDAASINRTLRKVRKIGYETVQVSGPAGKAVTPEELRAMADDNGLSIIGSHIGLPMMRDDLDAVIDCLHTWGCKYTAIPHMPTPETAGEWRKLAREFVRIGKKLKQERIQLQYHNHAFEFIQYNVRGGKGGTTGLEILFDTAEKKFLQAELDLGWVARGGGDPAQWAKKMKGRMHQAHIKDWGSSQADGGLEWMPVGEGMINWPEAIKACRSAGVKYFIYEQDSCGTTKDEFQAAEISYNNMRSLGLK